ncbi:unnamed protein product [Brachionus calyciflorus]|uniref:Uncharacterized protein n=1 Tax=Brachionus calyciflorus TaxID=104777 RepID=A0A813XSD3_9BILA|nr:unnamed protein product [Brachionus calyciflorus]
MIIRLFLIVVFTKMVKEFDCLPIYEQDILSELGNTIVKKNFDLTSLREMEANKSEDIDDHQKLVKLAEFMLFLLESKSEQQTDEVDKLRAIRELVGSRFNSYEDRTRSIKKPMKNEHRHVFIGKRSTN